MRLSILVLIGALAAGSAWAPDALSAMAGVDRIPIPWIPIPF